MQIFNYLHSVKNLNYKKIRNINQYEEFFYENEICNVEGISIINSEENDCWLEINNNSGELYKKISKLYLTLEKNGENFEVVYGHGLVVGNISGDKIVHPIFTTRMDLTFHKKLSMFSLKPYNNVTNIEMDILLDLEEALGSSKNIGNKDKDSLENILNICEELKALGVNPRSDEEVKEALKKISLKLNINIEETYNKIQSLLQLEGDEEIKIYNEPVIIFRTLDTRLWNVELARAIEKLRTEFVVPKTVQSLVTQEKISLSKEEVENWREVGEELLFPLPYNEEQKNITKRLSENFGVVVQGPPGTGKSHTIVNLICHLLAHGKRVLVTSQTDRALKVLNNKIPEEIKSLCISILGDDSKAMGELDEAVRKVTETLSADTGELKQEIKTLKYNLGQCRNLKSSLVSQLSRVYEKESCQVLYRGKLYCIADMAKFLKENNQTLSFIEDYIVLDHEEPLSNEEFQKFVSLYKNNSKHTLKFYEDLREIMHKLPESKEIIKAMEDYKEMIKNIYNHRALVGNWNYKEVTSFTNSNLIHSINSAIDVLKRYEDTLMEPLFNGIYQSPVKREFWEAFSSKIRGDLRSIYEIKTVTNKYNIELPKEAELGKLTRDFEIVYKTLTSKGKLGGVFKLFHKELNYIFQELLIDGERITALSQGEVVKGYLELLSLEKKLKNYYNTSVLDYGIPSITEEDASYLNTIEDFAREIEEVLSFEENYKNKIINLLKVKKFNRELNFYKRETYEYLNQVLSSLNIIKKFEQCEEYLEETTKELSKHKNFNELVEKIQDFNIDYVKKYYREVEYLKNNEETIEETLGLRAALERLCPKFKEVIENNIDQGIEVTYKDFQEGVKYSVFNGYIRELLQLNVDNVERQLQECSLKEAYFIKELVAKKAWYNQITRTTEAQKRSLVTWMEAIKRIGKGTGAQAVKYRRIAQREMENCKNVIPVWIMPINRVIENIKLSEELFDVVIVDESSQSDISALTVLMRAERAVIVGDEKQISPEAIGKSSEVVEKLIETHLKEIPHSEWFDLKTSLYATAQRVFPNRLVLKEHFRSLEEIIGFSNELCYSKEIIPLRCSSKKDILPPIRTVKVEEGIRDKNKPINIKEAYEVVEAIRLCCENPLYEGMTMGVISLLGEPQAELIESMLIEKIGIEEMVKRNIVCGDAYSFQGDERDVMFLSMVVGNNVRFAALSKDSDIRRFNVAASRAKNQMWLFHSVALEELSPKCVRKDLLEYMEGDNALQAGENEVAATRFVSSFAEDVQQELTKEQLHAIPNFRIGKYTFDFVIKENKNLAIKLIGHKEEELDNFEEESILQRAGWNFIRVRSSEFYLSKEQIINKIKRYTH